MFLGEVLFEHDRTVHFRDLTGKCSLTLDLSKINVSGQLLGYGRSTGNLASAEETFFDSTNHSDEVESVVRPEFMVFDGDNSVDHVLRNVFIFNDSSVSVGEIQTLYLFAVGIEHNRTLADLRVDVICVDRRRLNEDKTNVDAHCEYTHKDEAYDRFENRGTG